MTGAGIESKADPLGLARESKGGAAPTARRNATDRPENPGIRPQFGRDPLKQPLFPPKVGLIGQMLERTTAAATEIGTRWRTTSFPGRKNFQRLGQPAVTPTPLKPGQNPVPWHGVRNEDR